MNKSAIVLLITAVFVMLMARIAVLSAAVPQSASASSQKAHTKYTVSLYAPAAMFQYHEAVLVVQVRTPQGHPVDGLPVEFLLPPTWTRYAAIQPQRRMTRRGMVRAVLRAGHVGLVPMTVRVGAITRHAVIAVLLPVAALEHTARCPDFMAHRAQSVAGWEAWCTRVSWPSWMGHVLPSEARRHATTGRHEECIETPALPREHLALS